MTTGESLEAALVALPPSLRGFFQKVIAGVNGALHATLLDTLVGEFHEKFNAMWNTPGDRDAARALRQCDRTHRETALKVAKEVLSSQLVILAKGITNTLKEIGPGNESGQEDLMALVESQIIRLEQGMTEIEANIGCLTRVDQQ